jgi:hypothetical protein
MDRVNNLMVFDIMPERKVVFLEHNINVQDTLSILEDKRISSAPVRCPLSPRPERCLPTLPVLLSRPRRTALSPHCNHVQVVNVQEGQFLGIVDMFDIVTCTRLFSLSLSCSVLCAVWGN